MKFWHIFRKLRPHSTKGSENEKRSTPIQISSPIPHYVELDHMNLISILAEKEVTPSIYPRRRNHNQKVPVTPSPQLLEAAPPTSSPTTPNDSLNLHFSDEISCSTKKHDSSSKYDTSNHSFSTLTVDAANVQIFHRPTQLKEVNTPNIKPTPANDNIIDSNNVDDFVKDSESTFRSEFNALLIHHKRVVHKQNQQYEKLQRLLAQERQLNKQLIIALNNNSGDSSPKVPRKYRASFFPVKITSPSTANQEHIPKPITTLDSPSSNNFASTINTDEDNELLLPPFLTSEFQAKTFKSNRQYIPTVPTKDYDTPNTITNEKAWPEQTVPLQKSHSSCSSLNSLNEASDDIFTLNYLNHSGNDELVMGDKFNGSGSTTPDSFIWQTKL